MAERHVQGDRAAERMADQVRPRDVERLEHLDHGLGEAGHVAALDPFLRTAMPGQVERDRACVSGKRRLVEHPAIQVAAETVKEDDWRPAPSPSTRMRIVRPPAVLSAARGRLLPCHARGGSELRLEVGDEGVDSASARTRRRSPPSSAPTGSPALAARRGAAGCRRRAIHGVGDLAGLDLGRSRRRPNVAPSATSH